MSESTNRVSVVSEALKAAAPEFLDVLKKLVYTTECTLRVMTHDEVQGEYPPPDEALQEFDPSLYALIASAREIIRKAEAN